MTIYVPGGTCGRLASVCVRLAFTVAYSKNNNITWKGHPPER